MNTTYTRLTLTDREEISRGMVAQKSFTDIGKRIGRPPSTISREVWSNAKYSSYHRAERSQERTDTLKQRGRNKILDINLPLKDYVYTKLRLEWSPEEIAKRVKLRYPHDMAMRISHETIYQHLYCLP